MRNFVLQEFVPKEVYTQWGQNSFWFIDERILLTADLIRERYDKPMICNNWHVNGRFNERGFRIPTTTTGASLSQHKFGRALDFHLIGVDSKEVREDIKLNWKKNKAYKYITTIEDFEGMSWIHIDIRNPNSARLKIVKY